MSIESQVLLQLRLNLTDVRVAGTILQLTDILTRRTAIGDQVEFRLTDKITEEPVTSVTDLLPLLTEENTTVTYSIPGKSFLDKVNPVVVTLDTHLVSILDYDTTEFTSIYGTGTKKLRFTLAYAGDNDATLPLKLVNVSLVNGN